MKRRNFVKGSAAVTATTMLPTQQASAGWGWFARWKYKALVPELYRNSRWQPKPPRHTKAIVIGSGFGGAISALRLAEKGVETTVLERGQEWSNNRWRQIFARDYLPDGRAFWHRNYTQTLNGIPALTDKFGGVMDVESHDNMDVWAGACVGGGSVVFTGVMIQPEQHNFKQLFGNTVSWDEMNDKYYPRVRAMLNLNSMPDNIYKSSPFAHSRIWDNQARKAGFTTHKTDSIFNWDVINDEINGRTRKSATIGESNYGNSNGAKFDLNQNYLKQAQATRKAKVYSGQQVENISFDGSVYTVEVKQLDPHGKVLDHYELTCDYLFMAAGSMGTSKLLVRAREKGTLPNLNAFVGEGWGANGDTIVSRSFGKPGSLTQGSACASRLYDESSGQPTTLENWYAPGLPIDIGIIGSLGMVMDSNRGHFSYDHTNDDVKLHWSKQYNNETIQATRHVHDRILDASGMVPGVPLFRKDVEGGFTAHPLGGAVIGKATDAYGRLDGYKKLYVMDGAAIPGSTGAVNPSLTISALAERNIEEIIDKDF